MHLILLYNIIWLRQLAILDHNWFLSLLVRYKLVIKMSVVWNPMETHLLHCDIGPKVIWYTYISQLRWSLLVLTYASWCFNINSMFTNLNVGADVWTDFWYDSLSDFHRPKYIYLHSYLNYFKYWFFSYLTYYNSNLIS